MKIMPMSNISLVTAIRTLILAGFGFVAVVFPGLVPDGVEEAIADAAVQVVGGVLLLWASVAGWRLKRQTEGKEQT
jgi:hypothetical protein